mmetsp:Transcript_27704/g.65624  ORF Transcript_27704/g.65624 Transcript_27704/m.65624 type:complete len:201 (+) Transcript_27704:309-911(+)
MMHHTIRRLPSRARDPVGLERKDVAPPADAPEVRRIRVRVRPARAEGVGHLGALAGVEGVGGEVGALHRRVPLVELLRAHGLLALALGLGGLLGLGGHVGRVGGRVGGSGGLRDAPHRLAASLPLHLLHLRRHGGQLLHAHGLGALPRAVRLAHEGRICAHTRVAALAGALTVRLAEEGAVGAHRPGVLELDIAERLFVA